MNQTLLLSYTELAENHVENVLNIHASQQPSQTTNGNSQFFRRNLLPLPDDVHATTQSHSGLGQQVALPLPANQRLLATAKKIAGERNQRRGQFQKPVTV